MATEYMDIPDATGVATPVAKPNDNGQKAAADSRPVALSIEDKAALDAILAAFGTTTFYPATQPISGNVGVAGSVAVTGTFYQATQPVSGTVGVSGSVAVTGPLTDTELRASPVPVSGTFYQATQPVSAASLPLPSGAATESSLTAISGKLPTLGAKDSAGSVSMVPAIDATFAVTGTFWQATQPVSGTVAVTGTFWQATQPVSLASLPALATGGNVIGAVTQSGTWNIGSIATLPALVAGSAIVGQFGIDQTSDGTSNKANIDASLKSGTATRTSVNSGTSSATILASNANRRGATIFNSDANALLLDLSGGTAAATRCQQRLLQYQSYEVGSGYTGAITGIWEADGSGIADVVEFT